MDSNHNYSSVQSCNTTFIGISSDSELTHLSQCGGLENKNENSVETFRNIKGEDCSVIHHSIFQLSSRSQNWDIKDETKIEKMEKPGEFGVLIPGISETLKKEGKESSPDYFRHIGNSSYHLECLDMNKSSENEVIPQLSLEKRIELFRERNTFSEIFRFSLLPSQFTCKHRGEERVFDSGLKIQLEPNFFYIENNPVLIGNSMEKREELLNEDLNDGERFEYLRKIYDPRSLLNQDVDLFLPFFTERYEFRLQSTRKIWSQFVFESFMKPLLRSSMIGSNVTTTKEKISEERRPIHSPVKKEAFIPTFLEGFDTSSVVLTVPDGMTSKELNDFYYDFQNFGRCNLNDRVPTPSPIVSKDQFSEFEDLNDMMENNSLPNFFVNIVPESQVIASIIQSRPLFMETNLEIAKAGKKRKRDFGTRFSSKFGSEYHIIMFLRDNYLSVTTYRKTKSLLLPKKRLILGGDNTTSANEDVNIYRFFQRLQTRDMHAIRSTRWDGHGNKALDQDLLLSIFKEGVGLPSDYEFEWNRDAIDSYLDISTTMNWGQEELYFNLQLIRNMRKYFYEAHEKLEDETSDEEDEDEVEGEENKKKKTGPKIKIDDFKTLLIHSYDDNIHPIYIRLSYPYTDFSRIMNKHRKKLSSLVGEELSHIQNISKELRKFVFLHLATDLQFLDRELVIQLVDRYESDLHGWEDDTRYVSIFDATLLSQRANSNFGTHKAVLIQFQEMILNSDLQKKKKKPEKMIDEDEKEQEQQTSTTTLTTNSTTNLVDDAMREYYNGISRWISSPVWLFDRHKIRFGVRFQALSSLNPRFVELELHQAFQFSTRETRIRAFLDDSDEVCPIEIWQASLPQPQRKFHFRNNSWIWYPIHLLLISPQWINQNLRPSTPKESSQEHSKQKQQHQQQMEDENNNNNVPTTFFSSSTSLTASNSPNGLKREKMVEIGISYWVNQVLRVRVTSLDDDRMPSKVYYIKPIHPRDEWKKKFSKIDPRRHQVNYLTCKKELFVLGQQHELSTFFFLRPLNNQMEEMYGLKNGCESWNMMNQFMYNMKKKSEAKTDNNNNEREEQEKKKKKMVDEDDENEIISQSSSNATVTTNNNNVLEELEEEEEDTTSSEEEEEEEISLLEEEEEDREERFFFTCSMYARKRKFVDTKNESKKFNIGDYRKRRRRQMTKLNEDAGEVLQNLGKIHPPVEECHVMKSTQKERNQFYDNVMDFH